MWLIRPVFIVSYKSSSHINYLPKSRPLKSWKNLLYKLVRSSWKLRNTYNKINMPNLTDYQINLYYGQTISYLTWPKCNCVYSVLFSYEMTCGFAPRGFRGYRYIWIKGRIRSGWFLRIFTVALLLFLLRGTH